MSKKPLGRVMGYLLERPWFLEKVRRSGHDNDLPLTL